MLVSLVNELNRFKLRQFKQDHKFPYALTTNSAHNRTGNVFYIPGVPLYRCNEIEYRREQVMGTRPKTIDEQ